MLVAGCSRSGKGDDPVAPIPEPENFAQVSHAALLQAVTDARAAVAKNPEAADAWGRLGHIYQAHEWESYAAECYRRATELEPLNYRWFYYLGRSLQTAAPDAAAEAFSRATELDEDYAPAHLYLAYTLRGLNEFEEATRELERLEELVPGNSFSELGLGELALARNDFEGARRHLELALERNPKQSAAHSALAKVCMALGDRESAKRHAGSAGSPSIHQPIPDPLWDRVEMAGVTPKWLIFHGRHELRERDYKSALVRFENAVPADERDPGIWLDYGAAALGSGETERSVQHLEKALALVEADGQDGISMLAGDLAMLYNNLGLAYEQLKEPERSEENFRQAIETSLPESPERAMATNNLAAFFVRIGAEHEKSNRLTLAESAFSEGLALVPDSPLLLNNLAVVYRRQGRRREAIEVLERSLKIREDPRTLRMLELLSNE